MGEKEELLEEQRELENDCRGWFETEEEFQERLGHHNGNISTAAKAAYKDNSNKKGPNTAKKVCLDVCVHFYMYACMYTFLS